MLIHTRKKALAQGPIPLIRRRIDLVRRLVPVRGDGRCTGHDSKDSLRC